jgi:hypothetical protein
VVSRFVSLSVRDRYRLRLLTERGRFYADETGLSSLARRGLVVPTGQIDKAGRTEWSITEAGRARLVSGES